MADPAGAQSEDAAFENLAESYVGDLSSFSPVNATVIGDHNADHLLDNVDAGARKKSRALYAEYRLALATIDRVHLSRANQVDAELLHSEIESRIWSMDTLQEWAWNPLIYISISGQSIYGLVAREFAPIETRLDNAASRLEQMPRFMQQARNSIQAARVPKIHAETAIKQNPGLVTIIESMIVPHIDCP